MNGKYKYALVSLATYTIGSYIVLTVYHIAKEEQTPLGWFAFFFVGVAIIIAMYHCRRAYLKLFLGGNIFRWK